MTFWKEKYEEWRKEIIEFLQREVDREIVVSMKDYAELYKFEWGGKCEYRMFKLSSSIPGKNIDKIKIEELVRIADLITDKNKTK